MAICIVIFVSLSYAQHGSYKDIKECIDNVDVGEILSDVDFFFYSKLSKGVLNDYAKCKAIATYDKEVCKKLIEKDSISECIDEFNKYVGFYSPLFSADVVTPEALRNCPYKGGDMDACKKFAKAILEGKGDVSVCRANDSDCISGIALDPSKAKSQFARDMIYFINAIKYSDVNNCYKITNIENRRACLGFLKRDANICKEDQAFIKARSSYCTYYFIRQKEREAKNEKTK